MKLAIIGDVHISLGGSNQNNIQNINDFFQKCLFPYIKDNGITTILQTGDLFHSRSANSNIAIANSKDVFFDYMEKNSIEFHVIVGNHDMFYLQKISPNSLETYLAEYSNISIYTKPETKKIGEIEVDFIPWICDENKEDILKFIKNTKSKYCICHPEINGFEMSKGHLCENGLDRGLFSNYDMVWAGHFHSQSKSGNIHYVGSPTQHNYGDVGESRGFHVFDTETKTMEYIENPYTLYEKIVYTDSIDSNKEFDVENKYVRIILPEEYDEEKYQKFLKNIWAKSPIDVKATESKKAMESVDISLDEIENSSFSMIDFISDYVLKNSPELEKDEITSLVKDLYNDAIVEE